MHNEHSFFRSLTQPISFKINLYQSSPLFIPIKVFHINVINRMV